MNFTANVLVVPGGLSIVSWRTLFTANTGSYTIIVSVGAGAGTGTVYTEANGGIMVEDIGPNRGQQ